MAGINVGTLVAKTLKVGTTQVQKMYLGASQMWSNWTLQTGTYINWSPKTNRSGFTPGPDARLAITPVRPKRMTGTVVNSQCDWPSDTYVYVQVSYDNQATWDTVYVRHAYINVSSGCSSSSGTFDVQVTREELATHIRVYAPNRHNDVTHNVKITEWYTK